MLQRVSYVSINPEPPCHEEQVSSSASGEVLRGCVCVCVCVHSGGHQYYIMLRFPALRLLHFDSCFHLGCVGNMRCWEVGDGRLIYPLLFPRLHPQIEWQLSEMLIYRVVCVCVCVFWGQIPVQPSRPCNSENGLLCFRWVRITGDEEGDEEMKGGALIQLCASITQAGRDEEEEEEEALKFRVEFSNFLFCCGLISCFEKKCDIPHTWSQTILPMKVVCKPDSGVY